MHLQHALNVAETFPSPDERHLKTLGKMGYLASLQGYPDRAEAFYSRMLKIQQMHLDNSDPQILETLDHLATIYTENQQYILAESLYTHIFSLQETELRMGDPQAATTLEKLAKLYRAQNRVAIADSLSKRAMGLKIYLQGYGQYIDKQYTQAESLYRKALAIQETRLGPTHPDLAMTTFHLALLYDNQGKHQQAATFYHRALTIQTAHLGQAHSDVALIQTHLNDVLAQLESSK